MSDPVSAGPPGANSTGVEPTNPMDVDFQAVSPRLITVRLIIGLACVAAVGIAAAVVAFVVPLPWLFIVTGVCALMVPWLLWLIPRQVRAMGYATTESDFMVRKGIMFRTLVVVPYGRIQYVDVNEGPVARKYGIASIELHTASAQTDASLDGLPAEGAAELRDLLVANGASELSGL